jgi:hypothetical protein
MADLGTISILVDVRGQPIVKELATNLNNVAAASRKVSPAAQDVINKFKQMQSVQKQVAQANSLAANSFSKLHLTSVAKNYDTLTSSALRYSRAAQQSMQGANRFGMVSQQVGYQVGDFFVQVQSGTNALTAFGQQATQLAGLLPGLAGAIVGIGVSLGTAIGMAALRSQEMTINFQKIGQDILAALAPVQFLIDAVGTGLSYAGQVAAKGVEVLVQNLDRLLVYGTTIAALFAGKYVAGVAAATVATASLSGALVVLRGALIKTGIGALVVVAGELVYQFTRLVDAAGGFGKSVGLLWDVVSEFGSKVVALFNSLKSTFESAAHFLSARFIQAINNVLGNFIEMTNVVADGLNSLFGTDVFQGAGGEITYQLYEIGRAYEDSAVAAANAADAYYESATAPFESLKKLNEVVQTTTDSTVDLSSWLTKTGEAAKGTTKAAEDLRKELQSPLVSAVGSISDAFGDFVARGLSDFKGFVKSILASFQNMIAQMIAMAVKNRIMLSLGIGGITPTAAAAGQVAGVGSAGGMLGSFAGGGVAGTGLLGGFGAAMPSFLGGAGNGLFAVGANAAAAGGTFAATAGAIAAPLLVVAAVFSFFKKKTKELDAGLRVTVTNMDAFVKSFQTIQTTRFWGLSKKTTTTESEVSAEISDPIVEAVQKMQTQIVKAAELFGVSSDAFENFVYDFEVSLKGLTEEQKIQKINEEIVKMGDAFTALSGKFTSMNELLAAAQQRYDLTTRLLQLQGDEEALLARQRELELAAVHDLNRDLLLQIHTLEDLQIAVQKANQAFDEATRVYEGALSNLRSAMDREMSAAAGAVGTARDALEKAIQNRANSIRSSMERVVASLEKGLEAASRKADASRQIFEALDDALRSRSLVPAGGEFANRQAALSYVSGGGSDIDRLTNALSVLNEPSEQLFGTFQDYARDFAKTTNAIQQSRNLAEATMTADEKAVTLLEKRIEQAQSQAERQIQKLESLLTVNEEVLTVEQAFEQYLAAQATYEQLQAQHKELIAQFPQLNQSVLTVAQAVNNLRSAIVSQAAAQTNLNNAISAVQNLPKEPAVKQEEVVQKAVNQNQSFLRRLRIAAEVKGVPAFANGGTFSGGARIVGESGPELEVTGPSRIYSNRDTANMFRDPELAGAVDGLRREVSGMRSEQLQLQVEISKNVKRVYDIERKWDTDGLPPERV